MKVQTNPCISCGEVSILDLDPEKVERYRAGEHVQNVWPEKSPGERELLITGTHPECWDDMFKDDDPIDLSKTPEFAIEEARRKT